MDRHLFAGGNTPQGFYSYYKEICDINRPARLIILKGGSGVSKSTFIRKISDNFHNLGHEVELFHCSGDSESLDGAYCKALNIAIIDGTSPHMIDPILPAAYDEIVNLGVFINPKIVKEHTDEIRNAIAKKSELYCVAYQLLSGIERLEEVEKYYYTKALDYELLEQQVANISSQYPRLSKTGHIRKLFVSAITPEGIINYNYNECERANPVRIDSPSVTLVHYLLKDISSELIKKGYDIELFHNPIRPSEISALLVNDTNDYYYCANNIEGGNHKTIRVQDIVNATIANQKSNVIVTNERLKAVLISNAVSLIAEAKAIHKSIEKYYIDSMDWLGVEQLTQSIIESINKTN